MLKGKNIVLGITGGIAAYKSPAIVSKLRKQGANVKVIMTPSATEFITPLTMQTVSNNVVHITLFDQLKNMDVEHVSLAKWADLILVAPASANTIAKFANGICDNLLTTVLLAGRSKIVFAPAMNTFMLNHPATKKNIETLKGFGVVVLKTKTDILACNEYGDGKMLEPEEIVELVDLELTEKDLCGKRFVITSGPTIEAIDPVRYITNHSSGKMGYALAREAKARGAEVVLISGPTAITPPAVDTFIRVQSTAQMFKAVEEHFANCDVLIKAAAPADYAPLNYSENKIKKTDTEGTDSGFHEIKLKKNPDIAKHFGAIKGTRILVGFAAESTDEITYGLRKLREKNMDFIVVNNITKEGAGFKSDTNIVSIIDKNKNIEHFDTMHKVELAKIIISKVKELL
ncbi:bifunctional phosphopantothenoylcysteine decarboxylase/phosphopantothenate--cysteine ligase CoaBC [Treponema phagedenis]|uniref:Coenzyme A biosynthesis bifunctional protein CoaBC n=1 Tax=Treponema phagedenis TaxID=162 RepID=A0A0B7GVH2_TREPH|nr:bifunctional phosphopantothenoylcysteine decarboxylase/phosphopantothenate--cysteine ligase CoaBC [Treponema phagedenis]NVP23189.1 bifunctional phosphopantothenoylcysteine decarboxylase/phosphopantothenate--cysteine ligase CoaBC [Treponema phagedenis]QEJ94818.1 bifunctional phosphopantothenoylcysteine decarboxylase/phosphopantothenate--cysteine ligase CoaBC [Treponema phagedenis]QEJ98004.1 bifunctional phosphopantothenoylcysteine decarboxylase/phosphopantothenate--cysteine ligase CoaBC [Trepo